MTDFAGVVWGLIVFTASALLTAALTGFVARLVWEFLSIGWGLLG